MPITLSAFLQADAIAVMDREEVLDAKMHCSETICSNSENNFFFIAISSIIASIINSDADNS
jgi:hypothetical protein